MEEPKHITKNMIKDCLAELGIVEGDTVFFHSSMKSIGYIEGGADTVLDAFLETIVAEPPVSAIERLELAAVFPV